MALYDWNGDGKKDFTDDFIEYQIYKQSTSRDSSNNYIPRSGGGISTFGAVVDTVGGIHRYSLRLFYGVYVVRG